MNARAGTREQSALRLSIVVSAVMTVVAVAWGLASGSRVVLFDGVYILIGTALSGLGLAAARAVEAGASRRFPFGREALTPLVIGVQGLALLGTCAYAVLDSIRVIASGGVDVAPGAVAGYAVVSAVVSWGFAVHLRKGDHASELLDAEARQWMAGAVLSLVVGVGAVAALVLQRTAWSGVEAYVDPVLVIVACVLIAPHPVRMVRTMMTELLEGAPRCRCRSRCALPWPPSGPSTVSASPTSGSARSAASSTSRSTSWSGRGSGTSPTRTGSGGPSPSGCPICPTTSGSTWS